MLDLMIKMLKVWMNNLDELRTIIERYLPIRNPNAPIEAIYDDE